MSFKDISYDAGTDAIIMTPRNATGPIAIPRYLCNGGSGQNLLINGNFDFWQRGTSFVNPVACTADRWGYCNGYGTWSQAAQSGPWGSRYCLQAAFPATGSSPRFSQRIESSNTLGLAGKRVTFSFWVMQTSGTLSNSLYMQTYHPNSQDNYGGGETADITSNTLAISALNIWQKVTFSFNVSQSCATNGLEVQVLPFSNNPGSTTTFLFSGMMLNVGDHAAPFALAGGDIAGELAKCQRYGELVGLGCSGTTLTATSIEIGCKFAVPKRVGSGMASSTYSTSGTVRVANVTNYIASSGAVSDISESVNGYVFTYNGYTGMTAGLPAILLNDVAFISAEL